MGFISTWHCQGWQRTSHDVGLGSCMEWLSRRSPQQRIWSWTDSKRNQSNSIPLVHSDPKWLDEFQFLFSFTVSYTLPAIKASDKDTELAMLRLSVLLVFSLGIWEQSQQHVSCFVSFPSVQNDCLGCFWTQLANRWTGCGYFIEPQDLGPDEQRKDKAWISVDDQVCAHGTRGCEA